MLLGGGGIDGGGVVRILPPGGGGVNGTFSAGMLAIEFGDGEGVDT